MHQATSLNLGYEVVAKVIKFFSKKVHQSAGQLYGFETMDAENLKFSTNPILRATKKIPSLQKLISFSQLKAQQLRVGHPCTGPTLSGYPTKNPFSKSHFIVMKFIRYFCFSQAWMRSARPMSPASFLIPSVTGTATAKWVLCPVRITQDVLKVDSVNSKILN